VCVPQCVLCERDGWQDVWWKVGGVGDSKARAVGVGPRQSSEGGLWGRVVPAEGLKLIRRNSLVQRDGII